MTKSKQRRYQYSLRSVTKIMAIPTFSLFFLFLVTSIIEAKERALPSFEYSADASPLGQGHWQTVNSALNPQQEKPLYLAESGLPDSVDRSVSPYTRKPSRTSVKNVAATSNDSQYTSAILPDGTVVPVRIVNNTKGSDYVAEVAAPVASPRYNTKTGSFNLPKEADAPLPQHNTSAAPQKTEPGIDPQTNHNFRYSDSTAGGRISKGRGGSKDDPDGTGRGTEWGLSQGVGAINSATEKALRTWTKAGKARFNLRFDKDGRVDGEADLLYPLVDTPHTTIFTQVGGRSMWDDRWIGNVGLGHRWFPMAHDGTTGKLMLGYNIFFDYDFTRDHKRGGAGIEAQYDWVKISSNAYAPLSNWKNSKDLDYYQERPAKGWDIRSKAYLPFYRYVALTGSYTRWYGDEVGVFGHNNREKDPKVWSYGVEYTPIPLVSAYVNQKRTDQGQDDSEYGVKFNWNFDMPWDEQVRPSRVTEMRTMGIERYDFVDREYKIILEYRLKTFKVYIDSNTFAAREGTILNVPVTVHSPAPVTSIQWEGTAAGFSVGGNESGGRFQMPAYNPGGNNTYNLRVVMKNAAGQTANSQTVTITVIDENSTFLLTLSAAQNSVGADGDVALTATLTNAGAPVSGVTINLTSDNGGVITDVTRASGITNSNGQIYATFEAPNTTGICTVTASVAFDPNLTAVVSITITNDPAIILQVPNDPKVGQLITIIDLVKQNGLPVSGTAVSWAISGPNTSLSGNGMTDSSGQLTQSFTPTTPGTYSITVTALGITRSVSFTVTTNYSLQITPSSPNPLPGQSITLTGTLKDGSLPVSGATFTWQLSGDGTLSTNTTVTNASGQGSVIFTAGASGGPIMITATADTIPSISDTINFAVGTNYMLNVSPTTLNVATLATTTIAASLSNNNLPLPGQGLTWTVNPPSLGTVTDGTPTDISGQAIATFTAGTSAASGTITVALTANPSVLYTIPVTVTPNYTLTLSSSTATPDIGDTVAVVATLMDGAMPVSGITLNWSLTPTTAATFSTAPSGTTDANGKTTAMLTVNESGTFIVTAALPNVISQSTSFLVASNYTLTLVPTNASPAAGDMIGVTATLTNAGTPVTGVIINWAALPNTGITITGNNGITDALGKTTISLQTGLSGTVNLSSTAATSPAINAITTLNITSNYNLTVSASNLSPQAGSPVQVTALLMDGITPVTGQQIAWSISPILGGTFTQINGITGSDGKFTTTLNTGLSGTTTATATCSSLSLSGNVILNVSSNYSLTLTPSTQTPDAGDQVQVTALLLDGNTPVPNISLTWSLSPVVNSAVVTGGRTTGSDGTAIATLDTGISGPLIVTVNSSALGITQSLTLTVAPNYTLTLTPDTLTPGVGDQVTITAVLKDGNIPLSGNTINWSSSAGSLSTPSGITDAAGATTVVLTTDMANNVTITAQSSTPSLSAGLTLNVAPDYTLILTPSTATPTLGTPFTVQARLKNGPLPVSGITLNWQLAPNTAGTVSNITPTDANGETTVDVTIDIAGTIVLTAQLPLAVSASTVFTITNNYSLTLTPDTTTPKAGDTINVTATLLNAGLPVAGDAIAWSIATTTGATSSGGAATDATGQSIETINTAASGSITVTATTTGTTPIVSHLITITVAPDYSIVVSADNTSPPAGGTVYLTAVVKDGNTPVQGVNLNWSAAPALGYVFSNIVPTDSTGTATATIQIGISGTTIVTAAAPTLGINDNVQLSVNSNYSLDITPDNPTPSTGDTVNFTATLLDGDTPVQGAVFAWDVSPASGGIITSGNPTDANGQTTATLTTALSGDVSVTATSNSPSISRSFRMIIAPRYNLSLTADTTTPTAGSTVNLKATLKDGNTPLPGTTLTFGVSPASGGIVSPSSDVTDANGEGTVALTIGQSGQLTVSVTSSTPSIGQTLILSVAPNYSLILTPDTTTPTIGVPFTVQATLTDGSVPLPGVMVNWALTPVSAGIITAGGATDANGQTSITVTLDSAGTTLLTASSTTPAVSKSVSFTVASDYTLTLTPDNTTPAAGDVVQITAALLNGVVPVVGENLLWSVSSGTGATIVGSGATDANGQGTATLTLGGSGTVIVTATTTSTSPLINQNLSLTVASNYSLALSADNTTPLAGTPVTLTAVLKDGNTPLPGVTFAWSVSPSSGGNFSTSQPTDASGVTNITFTTGLSGSVLVTATSTTPAVSASIPLTIPSSYSLAITLDNPTPSAGDIINATATLLDNGVPVPGKVFTWSITQGTGATVVSGSSTDSNGQTTAIVTAGSSGTFVLTVTSTDPVITQDISITVAPKYSLTLSSSSTTPLAGSSVTLTAVLKDGNTPIAGKTVAWTVSPGSGEVITPSGPTDATGTTTATLTTGLSGNITVTAFASDPGVSQVLSLTILPNYTLTLSASNLTPDIGDLVTVQATLLDGVTPVSGVALNWSLSPSFGAIVTPGAATDSNGQTIASLSILAGGTLTLTASSTTPAINGNVVFTVPSGYTLNISVDNSSPLTGDTVNVTAELLNGSLPVDGTTIVWSIDPSTSGVISGGNITGADGKAVATLVTSDSGIITITASSINPAISQVFLLTVTPNYTLSLIADTTTTAAGSSVALTATLLNGSTPVVGQNITFGVIPTSGGNITPSGTTGTDGKVTATLITGLSGAITITANASAQGLTQVVYLTITPNYSLSVVPATATPMAGDTVQVTATLLDGSTAVPNANIYWNVSPSNSGYVTGGTTTDATGQVTGTFITGLSGIVTITATATAPNISGSANLNVTPNYTLVVTADNNSPLAGSTVTLTATLKNGNVPLSGNIISWSVAPSAGTTLTPAGATDASGTTTATLITGASGTVTVTATSSNPTTTGALNLSVVPNYVLTLSSPDLSPIPGATVAVTATLTDGGVPVVGQVLDWTVNPASSAIISGGGATGSDGTAIVNLTITSAGTIVFTASSTALGISENIIFTVPSDYTLTVNASNLTPNAGDTVTLTAVLKSGDVAIFDKLITWSATPNVGVTIIGNNVQTDSNGQVTVTLKTGLSGPILITATAADPGISQAVTLQVQPNYTLALSASTATPAAGEAVTLTATLLDGDTPVIGETLAWQVSPITGGTFSPLTPTDSNGIATAILTTGLSGSVTVSAYSARLNISQGIGLVIEPNYSLSVTSNTNSPTAGDVVSFTATLMDGITPIQGDSLVWSVSPVSGGTITGQNPTGTNGQVTVELATGLSGLVTVTATSAALSLSGSKQITVIPNYTLTLAASTLTPLAGETAQITATLVDGNTPVPGISFNWSVLPGSTTPIGTGSITGSSSATDANGHVTVTLAASTSGSITVQVDNPTLGISQSLPLNINSNFSLTISADNTTPAAGSTVNLTALLIDGSTPLSGKDIVWTVLSGPGSTITPGSVTDSNGQTTAQLLLGSSGTILVQATYLGTSASQTFTLNVAPNYQLTLVPDNPSPLAGSSVILTATLTDGGVPVQGQTLSWSITPGHGTLSGTNVATSNTGISTATLNTGLSGTVTVTASFMGASASSNIVIAPDYSITITGVNNPTPTAGNIVTFTALVKDGTTPAPGISVDWSVITGSGSIAPATVISGSDGTVTGLLTTGLSGSVEVKASLVSGAFDTRTIAVTPNYMLTLSADNAAPAAGNTVIITGTLLDGNTPVSGSTISWSIPAVAGASITPTSTTNSNGQATTTLTTGVSGSLIVTGTSSTTPPVSGTVTIAVAPNYSIVLNPETLTPTVNTSIAVDAILHDGITAVPGQIVVWTVTPNSAGTITPGSVTDATGKTTANVFINSTGTITLAASSNGVTKTILLTVDSNFSITVTANTYTPTAGDSVAVTATLKDSLGDPISGQTVQWDVPPQSGGTILPVTGITNAAGQATATLVTGLSGTTIVTASAVGPVATNVSGSATFTVAPNYSLVLQSNTTTPTAGQNVSFTATLMDGTTPVSGKLLNWTVTPSSGGTLSGQGVTTDSAGNVIVTLATGLSGTVIVRAYSPTLGVDQQVQLTVASNYNITVSANNTTPLAGSAVQVTAVLKDGNTPVSGQVLAWAVSPTTGGTLTGISAPTDGNGQVIVTLATGLSGSTQVTATALSQSGSVTITTQSNYSVTLTSNPASPSAGQSATVTATLLDGTSPVQGQVLNWAIITGSGAITGAGNASDANGQITVTISNLSAGIVTIASSSVPLAVNQTITLNVTHNYTLSLSATTTTPNAGDTIALTALMKDGSGLVSGDSITWVVTQGTGSITGGGTTGADGKAIASFTTGLSGTVLITATSAISGLSSSITVTVAPKYSLSITTANTSPSAGTSVNLTATLLDGTTAVVGATINWAIIPASGGTITPVSGTTNANGQVTASLATGLSGTYTVTASSASPAINQTLTLNVQPNYSLTLSPLNSSISAGATEQMTATLLDGNTPVSGKVFTWATSGTTGATFTGGGAATNLAGQVIVTFVSGISGSVPVTVSNVSLGVSQNTTVTVTPNLGLSVSASTLTPAAGQTITLIATLKDGVTPLAGQVINWTTAGQNTGVTITGNGGTTGSDGTTTITLTTGLSGSLQVTAADGRLTSSVTLTVSPNYSLTVTPTSATANAGSAVTFTAVLHDGSTPVSGTPITWSASPATGVSITNIGSGSTDATGTVQISLSTGLSGTVAVTATSTSPAISQTVYLTVNPNYSLTLVPSPTTVAAGGTFTVLATLYDGTTPAPGKLFTWSASPSIGVQFTGTGTPTNSNGQMTATVQSGASTPSLTIIAASAALGVSQNTSVTVTPNYSVVVTPPTASMNTYGTINISATALDGSTPVSGQTVSWSVTPPTGGTVTPGVVTNAAGVTSAQFTAGATAGTYTVTATWNGKSSSTIVTVNNNYILTITPSSSNIPIGTSTSLTATLKDGTVPVSGATINWLASPTLVGTISGGTTTDASGHAVATFTATNTTGTSTITATMSANPSITTQATVIVSNYNFTLASSTTTPLTGNTVTLTATLKDSANVPINTATINWSIQSGGTATGNLGATTSTTNTSGISTNTFTVTKAGTVTLIATLASNPTVSTSVTLTITPQYTIVITQLPPASIKLLVPFTVIARVLDNGVPVQGIGVDWSASGLGVLVFTSQQNNVLTNVNGYASVSVYGVGLGIFNFKATIHGTAISDTEPGLIVSIL